MWSYVLIVLQGYNRTDFAHFRLLESVSLPSFEERQPLTVQSFKYCLLAYFCHYVMAVLVLLPRTFALRLALFPITLSMAFRAALLDFSGGNPEFAYLNQAVVVRGFLFRLSTFVLTFTSYLWFLFFSEHACGHLDWNL